MKENGIGSDLQIIKGIQKEMAEEQLKRFFEKNIPIY